MIRLKSSKAITLIALVITIVVLIILAAVAINLSLGNNGIFNRAKTAKEQYQNAEVQEQTEVAKSTNQIDSYVGGDRTSGVPSNNYSLEEQVVGTWVDGKNIYQKTYKIKMPSSSSAVSNILPSNFENVININGCFLNSNNHFIMMNSTYSNDITLYYRKNENDLYVLYHGDISWAYNRDAYVTLQYTKTTD